MKDFLYEFPSYLFSIAEGIAVFLVGFILVKLPYEYVISIMVIFMLVRKNAKKPCHYKSRIKCVIFSLALFFFLFLAAKVDYTSCMIITVIVANMLTEKGDIRNTFEHFNKGNEKKYIYIEKYLQEHKESREIKEFEDMLKTISYKYQEKHKVDFYEIYLLKFYENKSLDKIIETTNLNSRRAVINALDMIAAMFYSYMNLKNLDEELTTIG